MTRPFDITAPLPSGTLIEASAGTGKTHAVAATVTKALAMDASLRIGEVLVTTFTRNAAAELRERIRSRLIVTATLLRGQAAPIGYTLDELDEHLLDADMSERVSMARRLEQAAVEFDTATIGTIHSVCSRVLRLAGIEAAENPDDDFLDRVLDEVTNDAIVAEAIAGRHWNEGALRELVRHSIADPFLELTADTAAIPEAHHDMIDALPGVLDACVDRARERLRISPGFDELLVRTWDEVTIRDTDTESTKNRKKVLLEILRNRFRLAIVDEAQDTNRLQWEIFHAIFQHDGRGLLVAVGDPKQAIYGFRGGDVNSYLHHAQDGVPPEDGARPRRTLSVNRRSDGPLVAGLNTLMEGAAFGDGIAYVPVEGTPGREQSRVPDLAAVELLDRGGVSLPKVAARKVSALLSQACYSPSREHGPPRPFRPEEICVLVRVNAIGTQIAGELRALGIPVVTGGTASVMESAMAEEVRHLLEAMEKPSSQGKTRRAAATAFFGERLENVADLPEKRILEIQGTIAGLHSALQRKGIAALASTIMANPQMTRLIGTGPDGDRRLVDFAHVMELLEGTSRGRGAHAREILEQFGVLATRDDTSELVSRRVESDAAAVTVMTVHAAKGLQFPCVVVVDRWSFAKKPSGTILFHVGGDRSIDIGNTLPNGSASDDSKEAAKLAKNDELRRLVYVALTRPEHHLCVVRDTGWQDSILRDVVRDSPSPDDSLAADALASIVVRAADDLPEPVRWESSTSDKPIGWAPVPESVVQTYRRTSYSGITSQAERRAPPTDELVGTGQDDEPSHPLPSSDADDGSVPEAPEAMPELAHITIAPLPAGTAFGSMVHKIFEQVEGGRDVPEADLRAKVSRAVESTANVRFLANHRETLAGMVGDSLITPFGGPAGAPFHDHCFADFAPADRLAELDFEMALTNLHAGVQARHVGRILRGCIDTDDPLAKYAERLAGPAFAVPLAGIVNGSIDALLRLPDRPDDSPLLLIADYKTNRLHDPDATNPMVAYAPARLVAAMTEHHYPLQALLYGTAVWRLLRWRLGPKKPPNWDPGECIAGVVYGFIRGMKGRDTPTDASGRRYGVFTWQPPPQIWRRLSDLFAGDLTGVNA